MASAPAYLTHAVRLAFALAAALHAVAVQGAEEPLPEAAAPVEQSRRTGFIDRSHASLSAGVEAVLSRADALFAGSESYDAPTGSYLRLGGEFNLLRHQDGGLQWHTLISAKIRLPRAREKLQLIVDRGLETIQRSASESEAERAVGQKKDESVFVGLRAIVAEALNINLTADTGLRFKSLSPDPYLRGRAQRVFQTGLWSIPISQTLLWRLHDGFSAATEIAVLRELSDHTVFNASTGVTFTDKASNVDAHEVLSLTRKLSEDALVSAEAGAFAHTNPQSEITAYTVAARYRKRMYQYWLFGEIRPQVTFPKDKDYNAVPSLTMRVEAYFGKGKLPGL